MIHQVIINRFLALKYFFLLWNWRTRFIFKSIKQLDLKLGETDFSDHQEYTESVITELSAQIKSSNCTAIITTEKDLVKLPESFLDEFEVFVIKIEVEFETEKAVLDMIQPVFLK